MALTQTQIDYARYLLQQMFNESEQTWADVVRYGLSILTPEQDTDDYTDDYVYDSDIEDDKQEQIRQLKFKVHVADFLRYKLASYWGINMDIDEEVFKYEYNDIEKTKIGFVLRLIDQIVKNEVNEYQEILKVMTSNVVCRLCCLIKLLEVNSTLLQDILVNWKLKEDRSGMFGY